MYGKFFSSAFTGSLMGSGPTVFAVWGYVIANAVSSQVELNPALVGLQIGCPVKDVNAAIELLCAPDPQSRSPEEEGRRLIREGSFAYRVVNHEKYRGIRNEDDRRYQVRKAVAKHRAKKADDVIIGNQSNHGKPCKPPKAHTEAEAEAEAEAEKGGTPELADGEVGSAGWIRDNFDRLYSAQSNTVARRRRAHDEMGPVRTWSEENVAPLDAKTRAAFEGEFTRAAKAFFADTEPFVVKFRANLPYFLKNFDKYAMAGAPKKSNAERPPGYFFDPSTLR